DGGRPIAPDQAITVQEALFGYTMGGAMASGDENNRGSLEPGKWADLAVLSGNPLSTTPLTDIQVQQTWVAGRLVCES
ncbi:MAG: amidohydrolase family protein, partial [Gemmatimonadota bacterium]